MIWAFTSSFKSLISISEALLQDDRITDVGDWDIVFGNAKNALTVSFTVTSIFGPIEIRGDLTR